MHPHAPTLPLERRTPDRRVRKGFLIPQRRRVALVTAAALLWLALPAAMEAESLKTESRIPFLHHIPLRDAEGEIISLPPQFDEQGKPQEARANPFSTTQTCGK